MSKRISARLIFKHGAVVTATHRFGICPKTGGSYPVPLPGRAGMYPSSLGLNAHAFMGFAAAGLTLWVKVGSKQEIQVKSPVSMELVCKELAGFGQQVVEPSSTGVWVKIR